MTKLRIGIAGISGRMGHLLVEEIAAAGAELSGGTARRGAEGVTVFADADALFAASDVVIDFTNASAAEVNAAAAARAGKPLILGTSGLSPAQEAAVEEAAKAVPLVYSSNFAPAATVLFALIEQFAAALPPEQFDAEIVEMHHRQKVDAPSGTAIMMGQAVAHGRGKTLAEVGMESGRDGHTGPRATGPIGFASLRGGPSGGGAHAALRRAQRAREPDAPVLRPAGLRHGCGAGGGVGRAAAAGAVFDAAGDGDCVALA
jgi:4-hydroxy-tetrahydrodipicolinate reductase